ncbi:hypothetical protein AB1Y20_002797 [Prymnesium parvum]|uniref:Cyclic nucleotide-binding domain-containing protein n=1 Tax=Prymnesium parvum TaxID=97485 RepID=A0AB34JCF1_PRYPA
MAAAKGEAMEGEATKDGVEEEPTMEEEPNLGGVWTTAEETVGRAGMQKASPLKHEAAADECARNAMGGVAEGTTQGHSVALASGIGATPATEAETHAGLPTATMGQAVSSHVCIRPSALIVGGEVVDHMAVDAPSVHTNSRRSPTKHPKPPQASTTDPIRRLKPELPAEPVRQPTFMPFRGSPPKSIPRSRAPPPASPPSRKPVAPAAPIASPPPMASSPLHERELRPDPGLLAVEASLDALLGHATHEAPSPRRLLVDSIPLHSFGVAAAVREVAPAASPPAEGGSRHAASPQQGRQEYPAPRKMYSFVRPGLKIHRDESAEEGATLPPCPATDEMVWLGAVAPPVRQVLTHPPEIELLHRAPPQTRRLRGVASLPQLELPQLGLPQLGPQTSLAYGTCGPRRAPRASGKPQLLHRSSSEHTVARASRVRLELVNDTAAQREARHCTIVSPRPSHVAADGLPSHDLRGASSAAALPWDGDNPLVAQAEECGSASTPSTPRGQGAGEDTEEFLQLVSRRTLADNKLRRNVTEAAPHRKPATGKQSKMKLLKERVMGPSSGKKIASFGQSLVRSKHIIGAFRNEPNFSQLSDLAVLAYAGRAKTFARYSVIYREGAVASCFFVLMKGRVSMESACVDGKEGKKLRIIQATQDAKVCFGTEAFSGALRRSCTVTALTEAQLIFFLTDDLGLDAGSAGALADRIFAASVKDALKSTILFKHLSKSALNEVAPTFTFHKLESEKTIYFEGEKAECMYVLIHGAVSVSLRDEHGVQNTRSVKDVLEERIAEKIHEVRLKPSNGVAAVHIQRVARGHLTRQALMRSRGLDIIRIRRLRDGAPTSEDRIFQSSVKEGCA